MYVIQGGLELPTTFFSQKRHPLHPPPHPTNAHPTYLDQLGVYFKSTFEVGSPPNSRLNNGFWRWHEHFPEGTGMSTDKLEDSQNHPKHQYFPKRGLCDQSGGVCGRFCGQTAPETPVWHKILAMETVLLFGGENTAERGWL